MQNLKKIIQFQVAGNAPKLKALAFFGIFWFFKHGRYTFGLVDVYDVPLPFWKCHSTPVVQVTLRPLHPLL
jgi:hypothetical protein